MNKFKVLRSKSGLNIKAAAEQLNIRVDTLYKIEEGQRKPSTLLKLKLAFLYNCNVNDI